MVDTGIFATTAEVQRFVGTNASATYNVEAGINQYISFIEAFINVTCGYNFSDNYTSLNVDTKRLLSLAACSGVAMLVLNTDMAGFNKIAEVQTRFNVHAYWLDKCLALLKDKKAVDKINEG